MHNGIVVTGANGFVGRVLCPALADTGLRVRALVRSPASAPIAFQEHGVQVSVWRDSGDPGTLAPLIRGADVLVHLAGLAHVTGSRRADELRFDAANAALTCEVAKAAVKNGVRRFLMISSIKVNGDSTSSKPFRADDRPAPLDAYGRSKLKAEIQLKQIAATGDMEFVILRPPLVYGPHVRANFFRLMRAVHREWPLPFGSVQNQRSLISVWNLVDFIANALSHPRARNRTFLVSDGVSPSTPQLVCKLAAALGKRARLWSVNPLLLRALFRVCGQSRAFDRLCGSLLVDPTEAQTLLGWTPPLSLRIGIQRTAAWFLQECVHPETCVKMSCLRRLR